MSEQTKELVVRVARESTGQVFSEVWDKAVCPPSYYTHKSVVIDRANGRQMTAGVVISRAKSMAELIGLPYEEDLTWPCVAAKKLACKCPACIAEGRA